VLPLFLEEANVEQQRICDLSEDQRIVAILQSLLRSLGDLSPSPLDLNSPLDKDTPHDDQILRLLTENLVSLVSAFERIFLLIDGLDSFPAEQQTVVLELLGSFWRTPQDSCSVKVHLLYTTALAAIPLESFEPNGFRDCDEPSCANTRETIFWHCDICDIDICQQCYEADVRCPAK
jgi:hypothetical protein